METVLAIDEYSDLVDALHTKLGCTEELTLDYIAIALEDIMVFDGKQHDYGSANIALSGDKGILVRVMDKMMRLRHLMLDSNEAPRNESVEDSWADSSVYGVMARMWTRGLWPRLFGADVVVTAEQPESYSDNPVTG